MTGGPETLQTLELLGAVLGAADLDDARAERTLRALLSGGIARSFVNERLGAVAYGAPTALQPPAERLRLVHSPALRIDAVPVRPDALEPATVGTVTRHTLVLNAGAQPLHVRRFRQPRPEPQDVFDPTRRLEACEDAVLAPGEIVAFRAVVDAYLLRAPAPTVAIVAAGAHHTALRWHYDLRSLRPVRTDPTDPSWMRIRELLRLAEVTGDASLVPTLRALREHPSHFVRWAALQTVARLSPEDGRAWMRDAASDPHPQVRAAARRTVEREEAAWR